MPTFTFNGQPITPTRGWNQDIGAHYSAGVGFRFVGFKEPRVFSLGAYDRTHTIALQARDICTIRPDTVTPSEFIWPGQGPEDFRSGGAFGISPFGDADGIATHDAIMRRCPVALIDPATGRQIKPTNLAGYDCVRFSQIPGYAPNTGTKCYDDQHLVRAYRVGLMYLKDPFVEMDLKALLHDWKLVWMPRLDSALTMPAGQGHGNLGRAFAWGVHLAFVLGDTNVTTKARDVVRHLAHPTTGAIQRLKYGSFYGNPDPWTTNGVPTNVDVSQGIELDMHVLVFAEIGCTEQAHRLAQTVLSQPRKKWIAWNDGAGVGNAPADIEHAWIGIAGAGKYLGAATGTALARAWPIPHPPHLPPYNTIPVGPFQDTAKIRAALAGWAAWGKMRPAMEWL